MSNKIFGTIFLSAFILAGCVHESHDNEDCDRNVRIEYEWIDTEPQFENETVRLSIVSSTINYERSLNSDIEGTEVGLRAAGYRFTAWENAGNIHITNQNVYVETGSDGSSKEPESFSGGWTDDTVYDRNGTQVITVPMRLQARELIIQLLFTGNGVSLIQDVEGYLDGVTIARDLNNAFENNGSDINPPAIVSGRMVYDFNPQANNWTVGGRRLLGLAGNARQVLNLTVSFPLDQSVNFVYDVTEGLEDFHSDNINEPRYITIVLNVGADFQMSIVDWIPDSEHWLVAN